jgi:hypothetical protein
MKHAQQPSRAEPESPIPSYARRRRAVRAPNLRIYLISHPECKTARSCISGAPSCLRSPPFLSATPGQPHAAQDHTRDHSRKRVTMDMAIAMVDQTTRDAGDIQLGANSHRWRISPQMGTQNSRQYPCLCSLQCRIPWKRRITMRSISIQFLHCPCPSRYGLGNLAICADRTVIQARTQTPDLALRNRIYPLSFNSLSPRGLGTFSNPFLKYNSS